MTVTCKYCGNQHVEWDETGEKWVLRDIETGKAHRCEEYEVANPRGPKAAKRKQPNKKGSFLRWYGPRAGRTHAVLVEPKIDPDTPEALYLEPQYSSLSHSMKVRGLK